MSRPKKVDMGCFNLPLVTSSESIDSDEEYNMDIPQQLGKYIYIVKVFLFMITYNTESGVKLYFISEFIEFRQCFFYVTRAKIQVHNIRLSFLYDVLSFFYEIQ
jgi:hypothetical protein